MNAIQVGSRVAVAVAVLCFTVVLTGCAASAPSDATADAAPAVDPVEHGRYLVAITGCGDCHTPLEMGENGPQPNAALLMAGHPEAMGPMPAPPALDGAWVWAGAGTNTAYVGPWGVTYAANLTPDENTGIGIWTEEMFVTAMRTGRHMGQSRPIMPPMPWQGYAQASDEDLKAIFAYLRSLPPVSNRVPDYQPPPEPAPAPAG